MSRFYGRAPSGQRAHASVPDNPDPNITLVMGLSSEGVVAPFAFKGGMNGHVFEGYVRHQLAPQLCPGDLVLADGLGAHRVAGARQAIEEHQARYRILPPYSPDFSPVEQCGSKVKESIRAEAPRTVQDVIDAMGRAIGKVTPANAKAWFQYRGYRPRRRRPSPGSSSPRRPQAPSHRRKGERIKRTRKPL
jgi:transposase